MVLIVRSRRPLPCGAAHCRSRFESYGARQIHEVGTHQRVISATTPEADVGEFTCPECGATTSSERGMKIHVSRVHGRPRPSPEAAPAIANGHVTVRLSHDELASLRRLLAGNANADLASVEGLRSEQERIGLLLRLAEAT